MAVVALLEPDSSADPIALMVIDKTKGIEIPQADGIQLQTIKPAATARMVEIADKGLSVDDLNRSTLTFNDKAWRVVSHLMKPSPNGELDGEVYLILSDTDVTT